MKRLQRALLQVLAGCVALKLAAWLIGPVIPLILVLLVVTTAMLLILNWRL